ncbi:MAG: thiosulfate-binding protein SoxY [Polaromonas sp.]|nr:thiosulfate-binding protein SoxY [Polaromonas sp.]
MPSRRQASLHTAVVWGLLASTGLLPRFALALGKEAFEAKSLQEALETLGAGALTESSEVTLSVPESAENGALVPVAVSTTAPGAKRLLILVEKNPVPLIAVFNLSESVEPALSTRVKMAQSSAVYGVAITADGQTLYSRKEVRVTVGSCDI